MLIVTLPQNRLRVTRVEAQSPLLFLQDLNSTVQIDRKPLRYHPRLFSLLLCVSLVACVLQYSRR